MEHRIHLGDPAKQRSACLVAGVFSDCLSPGASRIDQAAGGALRRVIGKGDFKGEVGQTQMLYDLPGLLATRVLLMGLGESARFDQGSWRKGLKAAVAELEKGSANEAVVVLPGLLPKKAQVPELVREGVIAAEGAVYRFDRMKSKPKQPDRPLVALTWSADEGQDAAVLSRAAVQGSAIARGMGLAKDLGNLPGNLCTPSYLAEQAVEMAKRLDRLSVNVLEQSHMEALGMGALLSVAKGSRQPPKLIVLEYRGGAEKESPVVLVGKGLTFDAGGISIKPAAAMDEMKYDMCGAAAVFAAVQACAEMALPINVVGLVPSSENLPDGAANKPGDIVTSLSGQTIEILNTDAEGRLILCDALTYARRFKPAEVIDMATLTGAIIVALGNEATGLFANDDALAEGLLAAGEAAGDRAWRMPLWDEYQPQLDSPFADIANIGKNASSITAACFLSRFTKEYRWAHLDIAGSSFGSTPKGATGRPVPLLVRYLLKRCGLDA